MKKLTQEEFIERAQKIHIDENGNPKYDYSLVKYVKSDLKVKIICLKHVIFNQTPSSHINGKHGCKECAIEENILSQTYLTKEFIENSKKIHGDKYDYSLVLYNGMFDKVKINCNTCNKIFEQNPNNHIHNKHGCPICGSIKKAENNSYTTEEFINKVSILPDHKNYNYDKTIFVNVKNKVIITCLKEGHGDFTQTPDHHISGSGCPKCAMEDRANKKRLTIENIIEKSKKIHGTDYDYSLIIEYEHSKIKLPIKCNACNNIFLQSIVSHVYSRHGCPICQESKGEKEVRQFLLNNKIEFIRQYKFEDCKNKQKLPFDFYLPDYNICIEFDGRQHFESVEFFGGEDELKNRQKLDKIKTKYCKSNNIILLRISHKENIEEKLNSIFV